MIKKLVLFLVAYAGIMAVLWKKLTENTQVNEVLVVLFAISIIILTLVFEMHKINIEIKAEEENSGKKN